MRGFWAIGIFLCLLNTPSVFARSNDLAEIKAATSSEVIRKLSGGKWELICERYNLLMARKVPPSFFSQSPVFQFGNCESGISIPLKSNNTRGQKTEETFYSVYPSSGGQGKLEATHTCLAQASVSGVKAKLVLGALSIRDGDFSSIASARPQIYLHLQAPGIPSDHCSQYEDYNRGMAEIGGHYLILEELVSGRFVGSFSLNKPKHHCSATHYEHDFGGLCTLIRIQ